MIENVRHLLTSIEDNNVYAALVIGIVMAELRNFREAKEIFNQLLDSSQNIYILVNLGHLEFLEGNYNNALKIYQNFLLK